MDKPKIDLLRKKYRLETSQKQPVLFFARLITGVIVVAALVGATFSYQVSSTQDIHAPTQLSLFSTIRQLLQPSEAALEAQPDGRTNILLLGVGGTGHDGPQLSDTIIFTSLDTKEHRVGMLSLPRDLTVPIPGHGYRKINHANAFGELDEKDTGPLLASKVVGDVLDQEIHYYLRVDFDGFAKLIDDIGGIEVYVDNAFEDPSYPSHGKAHADCGTETTILDEESGEEVTVPTYECRFEHLRFSQGWTTLDGETALKFTRSRHGTNGEGSDFARARRQQKVLAAVKEKVFSASTLLNPSRIARIMRTLDDHIVTNLDAWQLVGLAREFQDFETSQIVSHVLDSSPSSPLYATSLNGAYVLLPKNDDWTPVRLMADQIFTPTEALVTNLENTEEKPKFVRLEIQNGTTVSGLAFSTSQLLGGHGYEVTTIGNAATRSYDHTVIYDLTDGQKPDALKELRDVLSADVTLSGAGWLLSGEVIPKDLSFSRQDYEHLATQEDIDFLIILGQNAANFAQASL